MGVHAIGLEVEDRIADELTRAVVGDVAATPGLEQRDAPVAQLVVGREYVLARLAHLHAEGDHRRVLQEEQGVADGAGLARGHQVGLQRERGLVRHETGARHLEPRHQSQDSMAALTLLMNSSATAPSTRRWS